MNFTERTARNAELQTILRTRPRLKLELLASVSRLFREHQIELEPEVLSNLTLSIEGAKAIRPGRRPGGDPPGGDPPGPEGGQPEPEGGQPPEPEGGRSPEPEGQGLLEELMA